jgi:glycosyltransferase involved in cell wall biosynthesis
LAVIAAFQLAFPAGAGEAVRLVLKTHNRNRMGDPHQLRIWQAIDALVAGDARIRVVDETLSYGELLAFKRACDCFVSLHRSEGFGFGLIEAMQLGIPVIATAYSGNMDFCTPDNCFLVDYELVQTMTSEYVFVERGSRWAEPSIAMAAAHMRRVLVDRDEALARSLAASRQVGERFSIESIARRYEERLREIQSMIDAQGGPAAVTA